MVVDVQLGQYVFPAADWTWPVGQALQPVLPALLVYQPIGQSLHPALLPAFCHCPWPH